MKDYDFENKQLKSDVFFLEARAIAAENAEQEYTLTVRNLKA